MFIIFIYVDVGCDVQFISNFIFSCTERVQALINIPLGATITPATAEVYTTDDHVINCLLKNIPEQITGVQWSPATQTSDELYNLEDGYHSGTSQTSTLTISSTKLKTLLSSSDSHTFTCKVTLGSSNTQFTATQTITIYDPTVTLTGPTAVTNIVPATLTCTLSGIFISSTVTWSGGDIPNSGISVSTTTFTLSSGSYNDARHVQIHTLTISAEAMSNLGSSTIFTCSLTPGNTPVTHQHPLSILSPEVTLQPAFSSELAAGDTFTLTCQGTGVDPNLMTVTSFWTHDDENVNPGLIPTTTLTVTAVKATLEFANMQSLLSGEYKCGINYGGGIIYSDPTKVSIPGVLYFPTSYSVVEGHTLTISIVTVTGSPAKTINWYKNGLPLDLSDSSLTVTSAETTEGWDKKTTSALVWTDVAASHQGATLRVEISTDQYLLKSNMALVKVLQVYTHPKDYKVLRGVGTYIYCAFEGPPQPSIVWLAHSSATASGTEVLDGMLRITSFNPTSTSTVYQSRLTVNADETTTDLYRSCRATYPPSNGKNVFTGGTILTKVARLFPIGIISLTGPDTLSAGASAILTAKADYPPEPKFEWKFNEKIIDLDLITGNRISSSVFEYVFTKVNMQVEDSGFYSVLASYNDYGSSTFEPISVEVVNTCPQLTAPNNGGITCNPVSYSADTSASCKVTCNTGYHLQTTQSSYTCTNGIWDHQSVTNPSSKVSKCLRTVNPTSFSVTVSVSYKLPWLASCSDYYGDYLRLSFPYLLAAAPLSCVSDGDCYLNNNYFQYESSTDACFTTGDSIWLRGQYIQNTNTNNDRRNEVFTQISEYLGSTTFAPFTLMSAADCVHSCGCCIKDTCIKAPDTIISQLKCSSNRKKRSTDNQPDFSEIQIGSLGNIGQITRQQEISCSAGTVPKHGSAGSVPKHGSCLVCVEGTYQSGDQCVECPIGSYQDQPGSTSCKLCPFRTFETHSAPCDQYCEMNNVVFGTSDPLAGAIVRLGDSVTIICNDGYQFGGNRRVVKSLKSCRYQPSCTRVKLSTTTLDVLNGGSLDLTCRITTAASPEQCVFYRESQQVNAPTSVRFEEGRFRCDTTVSSVQRADEGFYSCAVHFGDDNAPEFSNSISITVMELKFDSTDTMLKAGTNHHILCEATVPSNSAVVISWTKNGQSVGERLTSTSTSTMAILNLGKVTLADQGEYQCLATFLGVGTLVSEPSRLMVLGFWEELTDVAVMEGSSATLTCIPSFGEVSWALNNTPLPITATSLEIVSVSEENNGIYKCVVRYDKDTITSTATVTVSTEGIIQHPEDNTLQSGEEITVTCAANVDATFSWFLDNSKVSSGVSSTETSSTLVIFDLQNRSSVQCVVTTSDGSMYPSKIAVMNVIGFISSPEHKAVPLSGIATLHCSVAGEGLKQLMWLGLDDKNLIPDSWVETLTTGYITTSYMKTSAEGDYFCKALFEGNIIIESERGSVTTVRIIISSSPVTLGEDTTLTCSVGGAVIPNTVYWTRDGELIYKDHSSDRETQEGIIYSYLKIPSISLAEVGEYRCVAFVTSDLAMYRSDPSLIHMLGFVDMVTNVVLRRGYRGYFTFSVRYRDHLEVSCDLSEGDVYLESGDVVGDVIHYRAGVMNVKYEVREVQYSCIADYGPDIVFKSHKSKLYFINEPKLKVESSNVVVGETAVISLTAEYIFRTPSVHWEVNGLPNLQFNDSDSGAMITSVVQLNVTQDIQVEATVEHKDVDSDSLLTTVVRVVGVTGITGPETAYFGESCNLTCSVVTISDKTLVTWYHQDEKLIPHTTQHSNYLILSVVIISNLTEEDFGIYECKSKISDEKTSSRTFNLTKTNNCKAPVIDKAILNTTVKTMSHLSEISAACGPEMIVLKCKNGAWDRSLTQCPGRNINTWMVIASATATFVVIFIASFSIFLYKKRLKEVVSVKPPNTSMPSEQWTNNIGGSAVLNNTSADKSVLDNVSIVSPYQQGVVKQVVNMSDI